jgi:hypothetical protein
MLAALLIAAGGIIAGGIIATRVLLWVIADDERESWLAHQRDHGPEDPSTRR